MKYLLSGVAAIALLSGCDNSGSQAADEPVSEITLREGDPAEADAVIAAMSLTNSGDGEIVYAEKAVDGAMVTFTDITVGGDDESAVKAGTLVFEGLDMVDGQASFSKMSLNNISIEDEEIGEGDFTVASIELINPTPELAAWLASSLNAAEPAPFPAADQIGFAAWTINDVAVDITDEDGDGTISLDSFEVRDLADQKAARATLNNFDFSFTDTEDDVPVNMTLGSMSVAGLNLGFLEAIQQNMGDEEAMAEAVFSQVYDQPMDPGYDRFSLDSFAMDVAGASFRLPSLDASIERNSEGQPVKYVTKPFTMTLDADPEGGEAGAGLAQGLSMVGYEQVELKGAGVASYDPENDIVSFEADDNYFELVDGAKISYGGKIGGYAAYSKKVADTFNFEDMAEGAEPDPMEMQAALSELEIYGFTLRIEDDSLVNRVFNAVAAQSGEDPEQMRSQAAAMMSMAPMMVQGSGVDVEMVTELASAVSGFITEPGTLTVQLDPEAPLSVETLSAMDDPSMLTKEYLGFSATHKN